MDNPFPFMHIKNDKEQMLAKRYYALADYLIQFFPDNENRRIALLDLQLSYYKVRLAYGYEKETA